MSTKDIALSMAAAAPPDIPAQTMHEATATLLCAQMVARGFTMNDALKLVVRTWVRMALARRRKRGGT